MRSLQMFLVGGLLSTVSLALEAPVYTFGSPSKASTGDEVPSLSPANARLYLAERLGVSRYHSLADADEATLQLLSSERNEQAPLFADHEEAGKVRAVFIVEGVEDANAFIGSSSPVFTIREPPSATLNRALVEDFRAQAQKQSGTKDISTVGNSADGSSIDEVFESAHKQLSECMHSRATNPTVYDIAVVLHLTADKPDFTITSFGEKAQKFLHDFGQGSELTVVIMPPSAKKSKRSISSWGNYKAVARQIQKELPLSEGATVAADEAVASTFPMVPLAKGNRTTPKTTIPQCYPNEKNCNNVTASCTGHGSCVKKFTEKASDNEEGAECWACSCVPTVIDQGDKGTKTVYWGGPACQKKDVSTPFWLLAGFTIAIVSAITWGIGLLYSIGQEDLPSVLGAGVAGPTARK